MSTGLPGFAAEAALARSGTYRARARGDAGPWIVTSLIARPVPYGCSCGMKECCCTVWSPGGNIHVCCPRDGEGGCYSWTTRHLGRLA